MGTRGSSGVQASGMGDVVLSEVKDILNHRHHYLDMVQDSERQRKLGNNLYLVGSPVIQPR